MDLLRNSLQPPRPALLSLAQFRVMSGQELFAWKSVTQINVAWRYSHPRKRKKQKKVREIGSLIFDTPLQHDYGAGVEVGSLLSTEVMEEIDGRLAVTDVDAAGQQYVKFWIDDFHSSPVEEQAVQHAAEECAAEWEPQQPPVSVPAFLCSVRGM